MASSARRRIHCATVAFALLALSGGSSGCADEIDASSIDAAEEPEVRRLAQVHVVLQPVPDELGEQSELTVNARFAEYRALDPAAARVRADMAVDPAANLGVGQCVDSESLRAIGSAEEGDERELALLDVGDVRVQMGTVEHVLPLALVPDLLPWVSGVEYRYVHDTIPEIVDPDGTVPMAIEIEGADPAVLPGTLMRGVIPPAFRLDASEGAAGSIELDWAPAGGSTDIMVLEFDGFLDGDRTSEQVTCMVADSGSARIDAATLRAAGISRADVFRIVGRRSRISEHQAGTFDAIEMLVEVRDQAILPLAFE